MLQRIRFSIRLSPIWISNIPKPLVENAPSSGSSSWSICPSLPRFFRRRPSCQQHIALKFFFFFWNPTCKNQFSSSLYYYHYYWPRPIVHLETSIFFQKEDTKFSGCFPKRGDAMLQGRFESATPTTEGHKSTWSAATFWHLGGFWRYGADCWEVSRIIPVQKRSFGQPSCFGNSCRGRRNTNRRKVMTAVISWCWSRRWWRTVGPFHRLEFFVERHVGFSHVATSTKSMKQNTWDTISGIWFRLAFVTTPNGSNSVWLFNSSSQPPKEMSWCRTSMGKKKLPDPRGDKLGYSEAGSVQPSRKDRQKMSAKTRDSSAQAHL